MCRLVVFAGTCTRCGDAQTWTELSQELSCLEAKNQGTFGECTNGVMVEEHAFDQECQTCTEEDEGIGDLDEEEEEEAAMEGDGLIFVSGVKRNAVEEQEATTSDRKKQKT